MKLSAPIHILKSRAKELKRTKSITMTEALNLISQGEGYSSWSLLQSKSESITPRSKEEILEYLNPGDLMLIGARPGSGKTTLALEILVQATSENIRSYFFSLEYTHHDAANRINQLNADIGADHPLLTLDFSDDISSSYIKARTRNNLSNGSLIVIDYLQLLDQKRSNPEVQLQVEELKEFAKEQQCIILFLSQIDRSFENKRDVLPSLNDVRAPNPLDLSLFNKVMFLHEGKKVFTRPDNFEFT